MAPAISDQPYRQLFALGLISSIIGVALWPAFQWGWINYPSVSHSQMMILGFMLAFVSGFLMTALPKMSSSLSAQPYETGAALVLVSAASVSALLGLTAASYAAGTAQFVWLAVFVYRRMRMLPKRAPLEFMFVPLGLLWGGWGASIAFLQAAEVSVAPAVQLLGKTGLFEGFLLNLIVGLGSRMIPILTRAQLVDPRRSSQEHPRLAVLGLVLLNASLFAEGSWAWLARAGILFGAAVFSFKILRPWAEATVLGAGLRLAILGMILGYILLFFLPHHQVALLHIVFICGYGMLTLMVATRVVLSYGGQSLQVEKRSGLLVGILVLLVSAATLRAISYWTQAAVLWIAALLLWLGGVGRYLRRDGLNSKFKNHRRSPHAQR